MDVTEGAESRRKFDRPLDCGSADDERQDPPTVGIVYGHERTFVAAPSRCRAAASLWLPAAALARNGGLRQFRAVLLHHLDPDGRRHPLWTRTSLRWSAGDDDRLASRRGDDPRRRRQLGRACLGLSD